jgi:hypothetical protein
MNHAIGLPFALGRYEQRDGQCVFTEWQDGQLVWMTTQPTTTPQPTTSPQPTTTPQPTVNVDLCVKDPYEGYIVSGEACQAESQIDCLYTYFNYTDSQGTRSKWKDIEKRVLWKKKELEAIVDDFAEMFLKEIEEEELEKQKTTEKKKCRRARTKNDEQKREHQKFIAEQGPREIDVIEDYCREMSPTPPPTPPPPPPRPSLQETGNRNAEELLEQIVREEKSCIAKKENSKGRKKTKEDGCGWREGGRDRGEGGRDQGERGRDVADQTKTRTGAGSIWKDWGGECAAPLLAE